MEIKLNGGYVIKSDNIQFTLNKYYISNGTKSKGKEVLKPVGYYTNLESVFKSYLNKKILDSNATNIEELVEDVKETKKYIVRVMKDFLDLPFTDLPIDYSNGEEE